ncbi:hypothetical protein [Dyadobacter sandarakinus]|uniref:Uncharacterized protein n=1 Tax=Dyadobacter sandarakinus TaxID=2747268 RepID=A0ABX7I4U7_9BACT|nr:hypothetical protein [Dyadobacter sandarakinus]QRR00733.1 hypothetical protein HWI92_07355 [Dyadobacter sandarakinus]
MLQNLDKCDEKLWKNAFYALYEAGNFDEAAEVLAMHRPGMLYFYGLEWNYNQMKKYDKTFRNTSVAIWITYILLITWTISCSTAGLIRP